MALPMGFWGCSLCCGLPVCPSLSTAGNNGCLGPWKSEEIIPRVACMSMQWETHLEGLVLFCWSSVFYFLKGQS